MPFENKFPKDTKLYQLMTSKFGEGYFAGNGSMPGSQPDKLDSNPDEQEILRKIREVSMNREDFDEIVKTYMGQAGS